MKYFAFTLIAACLLSSCSKQEPVVTKSVVPVVKSNARITSAVGGAQISLEEFNTLRGSYVASIGSDDSSLRATIYDADIIRTLLADPEVVSVAIVLVHTPEHAASHYGIPTFTANGLTTAVVGLSATGGILNIYEHAFPCPGHTYCP